MDISLKKEWPALLSLAVTAGVYLFFWGDLPERVPVHWGIEGEPDRYSDSGLELLILPGSALFVYVLMLLAPVIDPKKKVKNNAAGYVALRAIITFFLAALSTLILLAVVGFPFQIQREVPLLITLMFLLMGNYLSKVRPNYFVGVRTPWTLENEDIWLKTHRLTARLWVATSIVMVLMVFILPADIYLYFFVAYALFISFYPILYSFLLYRKQQRTSDAV